MKIYTEFDPIDKEAFQEHWEIRAPYYDQLSQQRLETYKYKAMWTLREFERIIELEKGAIFITIKSNLDLVISPRGFSKETNNAILGTLGTMKHEDPFGVIATYVPSDMVYDFGLPAQKVSFYKRIWRRIERLVTPWKLW